MYGDLSENEFEALKNYYEKKGVVTANEVKTLDSSSGGEKLSKELRLSGYPEAIYIIVPYDDDFNDYSGVIYNPHLFTQKQAFKCVRTQVLEPRKEISD